MECYQISMENHSLTEERINPEEILFKLKLLKIKIDRLLEKNKNEEKLKTPHSS